MAKQTKIEWATATWNPWIGCTKVSPACDNCYAERWAKRCGRNFNKVTRAADATFYAPLKWKEPQRIFVCSLSDFFHDDIIGAGPQCEAWKIMHDCPEHIFILLTKRPENIKKSLPELGWPMKNVWLGCTVENQAQADKRIPLLWQSLAAVRFISVEPMLGPVNLDKHLPHPIPCDSSGHLYLQSAGIDWVICGGESGGQARPMHPDWARSLRDQCKVAGVPFMFKQWGEWMDLKNYLGDMKYMDRRFHYDINTGTVRVGKHSSGRLLDGVEHNGLPEVQA